MSAAQQFRYTMAAGATAVVIGVGFTVVGLNRHADAGADRASADAPLATQSPITLDNNGADLLLDDTASALPSAPASAVPSASSSSPAPKATTKAPKKTASPQPAATPTRKKTKAPSSGDSGTAPVTSGSVQDQVLAHINAARKDEGLPAYSLDTSLSDASALHNKLMINGCGLSHQCSGEGGIGDRFSDQGVKWSSAGENIGFGSAGSSNAEIIKAANGLTDSMLAETPPNDGHRKNLLSDGFKRIGLSVVRDNKGVVWMTQDFVG